MSLPLEDYCGTCNKVTPSKLIRHSTGDEFRCTVCGNQQEFLENDDDILDDDRDPHNPVDVDADTWGEIYSKMEDFEGFLDHDHSMDY